MNKISYRALTEHTGIIFHTTNIGVIHTEKGIILIDTADNSKDGQMILELLQATFTGNKIHAIINTHSHADHCGGNAYIQSQTGCEIWAPKFESSIMEYPVLQSAMIWGGNPFRELKSAFYTTDNPPLPTRVLEKEVIEFDNVSIHTIDLTGHFFGGQGFLVREKDGSGSTFYLGDAMMGQNLLKKYWIFFLNDPKQYRDSLETIENTAADFYIPAHGAVYTADNVAGCLEVNAMFTLETETLIIRFLEKEMTSEQILKAVCDYAGITLKLTQALLIGCTLRSYLSSLKDRKLIDCYVKDNTVVWKAV